MDVKRLAKRIWEEKENRRYRKNLARRRISYGEWAAVKEAGRKVGPLVPGRRRIPISCCSAQERGALHPGRLRALERTLLRIPRYSFYMGTRMWAGRLLQKGM